MSEKATLISKDELNNDLLLGVFRQAFMEPHLETDGSIKLMMDGVQIRVSVEDRGVMRVFAAFGVKPQTTRQQALELCNRINDELIFIRACYPAAVQCLWLDHYIDTNAGITALEAIDEVRRFRSVIKDIFPKNTEDILA